jgi:hypothetical protein
MLLQRFEFVWQLVECDGWPIGNRGRAPQRVACVTRAVVASVRHEDTAYDTLLMAGMPRKQARERIREDIDRVLERWRRPATGNGPDSRGPAAA